MLYSELPQGNPGIAAAPNYKVNLQEDTGITSCVLKKIIVIYRHHHDTKLHEKL
jgi:hypothetical protein